VASPVRTLPAGELKKKVASAPNVEDLSHLPDDVLKKIHFQKGRISSLVSELQILEQ
jgi:hypothetical protein